MNKCDKHSWFDEDDAKCPYCYPPKKRGVSKNEKLIKQLQAENLMLREIVEDILVLHVEGREFMTSSQLYEAVIQDCTKALNSTREK